jgi:hypothetical protein
MFYYHTDPQRQLARERIEQLARDMRRIPDPAAYDAGRAGQSWLTQVRRAAVSHVASAVALTRRRPSRNMDWPVSQEGGPR